MNKIFIQIASYRDNQLLHTLRDCIDKAYQPENLVFGIAWQHSSEDEWDTLDEFVNDSRFKIIDIDHTKSKGVCWARNQIQQLYDGEQYTLQLDSHHRFVHNWDVELVTMYRQLKKAGYEKPLLTSYLSSFNPDNDPADRTMKPYRLNFDRFTPEGVVFFTPQTIDDFATLTAPIKCRFYSAHFCFTSGDFCQQVQHDPNYYFHGEEISIAVRAYTSGYDLFSPHKMIAWHEYTRKYRKKHWDDHTDWNKTDTNAYVRLKKLLNVDNMADDTDFGIYGLGKVRTLKDYEQYAGVNFLNRAVQQYTLDNKLPPNPVDEEFIQVFRHCINVYHTYLKYDDYKFIAVIIEDKQGVAMHRQDIEGSDFAGMLESDKFYKIWRTFNYTGQKPYKYVVWPFSHSHGWCDRIEDIIYK
jgi:hypothetical protein